MTPRRSVPTGYVVPPLAERERPGLSETLPHPREPFACQRCGAVLDPDDATSAPAWARWQECDAWDRRTDAVVFLCTPCAAVVIDPSPRLYHRLPFMAPFPGAMPLCGTCPARAGVTCRVTRSRGGPGAVVRQRTGADVHLYYGGGRGEWIREYLEWPTACVTADGIVRAGDAPPEMVARIVKAARAIVGEPWAAGGPDLPLPPRA